MGGVAVLIEIDGERRVRKLRTGALCKEGERPVVAKDLALHAARRQLRPDAAGLVELVLGAGIAVDEDKTLHTMSFHLRYVCGSSGTAREEQPAVAAVEDDRFARLRVLFDDEFCNGRFGVRLDEAL